MQALDGGWGMRMSGGGERDSEGGYWNRTGRKAFRVAEPSLKERKSMFAERVFRHIAVVLLLWGGVSLSGAQTFQRVFGSEVEERSEWIEQTSDGGYIVAGWRENIPEGKAYVLKLDASGTLQWSYLIGGDGFQVAQRVVETDDGYVFAGEKSVGAAGDGIWLFKLDLSGTLQWARSYAGTPFAGGSGGGTSLDIGLDGGFILAGRLQGIPQTSQAPLLIRTDAAGNLIWSKYYVDLTYGLNGYTSFNDVHVLPDEGYIACGFTADGVTGDRKSLMVRFDFSGNIIWAKTYGVDGSYDFGLGVDPAANGDFLMTGFNKAIGEGGGTYLLRTDGAGNLLWYRTYRFFSGPHDMEETPTGDVILAGNANNFSGLGYASLLKTDGFGVLQWCWAYGGASQQYGESVVPTTDGGYHLIGWTDSFGAGSFDIYSVKTDSLGSSGCNEQLFDILEGEDQPPVVPIETRSLDLDLQVDLQYEQWDPMTIEEVLCEGGDEGPCPPQLLFEDFTSGVADNGSLLVIGDADDDWFVTSDPIGSTVEPRRPRVVTPNSGWLTIPGTRWISGAVQGPNGAYSYEYCFCLDERFSDIALVLDLRADDWAEVYLNGVLVGSTPNPSFNTPTPTHVEVTDSTLFRAGQNCVEIRVYNTAGVVTALNVSGFVEALDGQCCCAPPPANMVGWWPLDEEAGSPVAKDIAYGNDGSYINGPLVGVPGMVDLAVDFDGVDDLIVVPDSNVLDFGTIQQRGDLTIDAWIYMDTLLAQAPIVDKRDQGNRGYYFFIYDGNPALLLADAGAAPGYTVFCCSGPFVTPGEWHHVAVTVDRDQPNGVTFYVDGVPSASTYDPTVRPGSLANDGRLLIGRSHWDFAPGTPPHFFDGRIDEVEIFRRALGASEIAALYEAGPGGKCKDRCHVPWDKRFCRFQNSVVVNMTVCNDSSTAHDYLLSFAGLPAGSMGGCSIDGPTSFTVLGSNPVTVPPHTCVNVPVRIDRPSGMTSAYLIGCYEVTFQNLGTGHVFTCAGSVVDRRDLCSIIIWPPIVIDVIALPAFQLQPIQWGLRNDTDVELAFPFRVSTYGPDMLPESSLISLDGLPAGQPVQGELSIPPNETAALTVEAAFTAAEPFAFFDVVLETDVDGDGVWEPATSLGLVNIPQIPGDMNCDGVVNNFDIDAFVLALTDTEAYYAAYPYCNPLLGDINGDGLVNNFDIDPFVELLTSP